MMFLGAIGADKRGRDQNSAPGVAIDELELGADGHRLSPGRRFSRRRPAAENSSVSRRLRLAVLPRRQTRAKPRHRTPHDLPPPTQRYSLKRLSLSSLNNLIG